MTSLILLPLLTFVAANNKNNQKFQVYNFTSNNNLIKKYSEPVLNLFKRSSQKSQKLYSFNGSEIVLECKPADYLVRTHMAPDFENPQLVQKLNWFHEDSLIASFQQDVLTGVNEEWWVASTRFELRRPFYQLKINPVLASDTGEYKCFLETDPLFSLDQSFSIINLIVILKPIPPSKPQVSAANSDYTVINSNNEFNQVGAGESIVFLSWSHSVATAHRPIIRYSILINQLNDSADMRIIKTENNRTGKIIEGLLPNTVYSFSVRAENAAGESELGPETIFKTAAPVPKKPPKILSIQNHTNDDLDVCVEVKWNFESSTSKIIGFKITVTNLLVSTTTSALYNVETKNFSKNFQRTREWKIKKSSQKHALLCSLEYNSEYQISIVADTGYGFSPESVSYFKTIKSALIKPPESINFQSISPNVILVSWDEPKQVNNQILSYQIYIKEKHQQHERSAKVSNLPPTLIRLLIEPNTKTKSFVYNITKLSPNTLYELRLSSSTKNSESEKSKPYYVRTFQFVPLPPKITNISFKCSDKNGEKNVVRINWDDFLKNNDEKTYYILNNNDIFYTINFETPHQKFSLNSTTNWIKIKNLNPYEQYIVTVTTTIKYQINFKLISTFSSAPSKAETFEFDKTKCQYQSSVCSSQNINCKSIVLKKTQLNKSSILLIVFAVFGSAFVFFVFTYYLKKHCVMIKDFKKKPKNNNKEKKKNLYHQEAVSLFQDPLSDSLEMICGQTVTSNNFYEYVNQMSENDNEGFKKQFQEIQNDNCSLNNLSIFPQNSNVTITPNMSQNNFSKNRYINIKVSTNNQIKIKKDKPTEILQSISSLKNINNKENDVLNIENFSNNSMVSSLIEDDGYINANFVDSCDEKNAYIATQAPLPNTFNDFWSMVWQENCYLILMITNLIENGKRKCDQYWPSTLNLPLTFTNETYNANSNHQYQLILNKELSNSIFTHRIFQLKTILKNDSPLSAISNENLLRKRQSLLLQRVVHQIQFTLWPDHGVPNSVSPFLNFLNYTSELYSNICIENNINTKLQLNNSPIVVHCSAGVGRSGSFILIDSMRRHLLQCDRINIQAHLKRIRRQRSGSVQTLEQYIFCHKVLVQLIRHGNTRKSIKSFPNYLQYLFNQYFDDNKSLNKFVRLQTNIQLQFKDFCECNHEPDCKTNLKKPKMCIPLTGYHRENEFIVGRWPTECAELWSTVWTYHCSLIVLLGTDAEVGNFFNACLTNNQQILYWLFFNNENLDSVTNCLINKSNNFRNSLTTSKETERISSRMSNSSRSDYPNNDEHILNLNQMFSTINSPNFNNTKTVENFQIKDVDLENILSTSMVCCDTDSLTKNSNQKILLQKGNQALEVQIIRVCSSVLELDVWTEIEKIQNEFFKSEERNMWCKAQQSIMILDPRSTNSSVPFIISLLQSAACHLESEGYVDVPLYLDLYSQTFCGCWNAQSNIEYVYAKIFELIQLKQNYVV